MSTLLWKACSQQYFIFVLQKDDAEIGKVRIPVKDVVRNGRLKDKWPLQEVQQGEVVLMLTWTQCEFA